MNPPSAPPPDLPQASAEFGEDDARWLCLLRACEDGPPDAALWSPEDAAWASRLADKTMGESATAARWLAERARHAIERLLPRRTALARAFARRAWGVRWVLWATLAGFALGAIADMVGAGQHINLLAAPVWGVVAWNLLVYLGVAGSALRGSGAPRAASGASSRQRSGPLRRTVQRWLGSMGEAAAERAASGPPERRFAALWAQASAPLAASRAALVLHIAAAALALGLVAGLYARALVLDYRVSWQSTLLDPAQVHALLSALLAAASAATGIAVPGVGDVAALRSDAAGHTTVGLAGAAGAAGIAAAAWLHLLAATLVLAVIVPRLLLALSAAWQAHRRARRVVLPLADLHTLALLRGRSFIVSAAPGVSGTKGSSGAGKAPGIAVARGVQVLPHGFAPSPSSTLALRALLAAAFGEGIDLHIAAGVPYGDEDRAAPQAPAGSAWRIAWFDLAATPEPQAQGRFIEQLLAAVPLPLVLLVDESGYRQRMGAASARVQERRQAWREFARECDVGLACLDLTAAAADPAEATAALHAALRPRAQQPR